MKNVSHPQQGGFFINEKPVVINKMQQIQTILTNIAQSKKVQILYACETGSRAWGFPLRDNNYKMH